MSYGLSDPDLLQIIHVFRQHKEIKQVTLFGSRAMNTYRPGSDIDLALTTDSLLFSNLLSISAQLDELGTLYSFDVVDLNRLTNKALLDNINRFGVIIYQANG